MGVAVPEAKGKMKRRHSEAITAYKAWLDQNPKASRRKRIKQFDMFVDTAQLNEMVQR